MTEQKVVVKPVAGDSLLIGKYLTGFNKHGKPQFRSFEKGKEPVSAVAAVYEDGSIKSKEGDIHEVRLLKPALVTSKVTKPAQWITIA